jgi:hypothetical protein
MNHNSQPLYPTNAVSCACRQKPCQCQRQTQSHMMTPRINMVQSVPSPKAFAIELDFSKVDLLRNLHGYVLIDPSCSGTYSIEVNGAVNGFANLATFDVVSSNTLNLTSTVVDLSNGLKDITITGNVPLKVNGTVIGTPGVAGGYNFRTPTLLETPTNFLPVTANAGAGVTAGDVYFTVDVSSLNIPVLETKYKSVQYDGTETSITVPLANPLSVISSSNGLSISANNANDSLTLGIRVDTVNTYNETTVNANGLFSYHIPFFIDTGADVVITTLDIEADAIALPVGTVGVWKNNNTPASGVSIRKVASSGSNQWQLIGHINNLTFTDSSTVDFTVAGNNVTARVPLKIGGVAMSVPSVAGAGYNLVSDNGSIVFSDNGLGEVSIETSSASSFFSSDSAGSGTVNAVMNTNTQNVKFTGTLSGNRNIVLNTIGAVNGSFIKLSFINATFGIYNFNIVDQASGLSVETVNIATASEYVFNGTNWIKFS